MEITVPQQNVEGVSLTSLHQITISVDEIPDKITERGRYRTYPDVLKSLGCSPEGNAYRMANEYGNYIPDKNVPQAVNEFRESLFAGLGISGRTFRDTIKKGLPGTLLLLHKAEIAARTSPKKVLLLLPDLFGATFAELLLKFSRYRVIPMRCMYPDEEHWWLANKDGRRGKHGGNPGHKNSVGTYKGFPVGDCPRHAPAARKERLRQRHE